MTSTKNRKTDCTVVPKMCATLGVDCFRQLTWDKAWVRPYESFLSVYINFVCINAISYANIVKILKIKYSTNSDYYYSLDRRFKCNNDANYDFLTVMAELLLPDDYMEKYMYMFPEISGVVSYRKEFYYCPECIKHGYHSVLSQIPTEDVCPIHIMPYENSHRIIPVAQKGNYDIYNSYFPNGAFPMPPERKELSYSLIGKRLDEIFCGAKRIFYSFPRLERDLFNKIIRNGRRVFIKTLDSNLDYKNYSEKVWNYYCKNVINSYKHTENDTIKDELNLMWDYINSLNNKSKFFSTIHRLLIQGCMLDYIKNVDRSKWPGDFPDILEYEEELCSADDIEMIKASYCYAVRGSRIPGHLFSKRFPLFNEGVEAMNIIYTQSTLLERIEQDLVFFIYDIDGIDELTLLSILIIEVIYDQFWEQAKRYEEDIKKRGMFNFRYEWKNIEPIIYEIRQNNDNSISIYRITT